MLLATGCDDAQIVDLERLLAETRTADRSTRIELRDAFVPFGLAAVAALRQWLRDPDLAAFAVRTIERIGREHGHRKVAVDALMLAAADEPPGPLRSDIETALMNLGGQIVKLTRPLPRAVLAAGTPGIPGRHYWAMRTSERYRDFIWAEVRRGRLRQG